MKRMLVIALVACVALSLIGCGNSSESAEQQPQDYYGVKIVGAEAVTDKHGKNAVVIAFDFTNNTTTAISFDQAITTDATQDRAGLHEAVNVEGYTGSDGVTPDKDVKVEPGQTATVHKAFLTTSENEIDVRCALGFANGGFVHAMVILLEQTIQL